LAVDGDQAIGITLVVDSDVLVDTYRVRQFRFFQETTAATLPATLEQSSEEDVSCTVTVGTAPGQGFIVDYSDYRLGSDGRPDDPCATGRILAERVAAALPPLAEK
jgi:hypothetical protein